MLIGLAGGALWALDTVILGMALALPKGHLLGFGCALLCCIGWAAEGVICTYGLQSSTVTNTQALLAAYEKPQKLEKSNNQ